jgi:predicted RNA-binding protein YlqC (UPF0109 family)
MEKEALRHLITNIVDHPKDVRIRSSRMRDGGELLRVQVNPEDIGRVIGRSGRTATALRTVIQAVSDHHTRIDIVDVRR